MQMEHWLFTFETNRTQWVPNDLESIRPWYSICLLPGACRIIQVPMRAEVRLLHEHAMCLWLKMICRV